MSAPLVSVIMPAFRASRFVSEALDSALGQDYPAVEVIVVDDGSDDGTAELAAARPVRLLRQSHQGPAAARNTGLRAARGAYVTVHDADDVWPRGRLARQVGHLESHPEIGIVLGLTQFFLTPGEPPPAHYSPLMESHPVPGHASTMLARREVFDLVGCFDETMLVSEDIDWLARAKDAGVRSETLDELLLCYRIHAANTSRDTTRNRMATFAALRRSVHRQKGMTVG